MGGRSGRSRFPTTWEGEADATLRLREGGDRLDESSVDECRRLIDEYMEHDRIHWGEDVDLEEEAYQMCIKWQALGKSTLLLAGTNAQVRDINQRFILERRAQEEAKAILPSSAVCATDSTSEPETRSSAEPIREAYATRSAVPSKTA